jgi:ABC-type transporter Mla maintaining outer membrane lipid asymmetry ATPase subunit MlaF
VVTHELDSIRAICDRITFLSEGRVAFDGTLEDAEKSGPPEVKGFLARKPPPEPEAGRVAAFDMGEG